MPKNKTNTISDILKSLFHRAEKGFFKVTEVWDLLTADERSQLKITKRSTQKQVLEALGTLAAPYNTVKKGRSFFILNKSLQDALLEHVVQNPGKNIGEIAKVFPLTVKGVVEEANELIQQGSIMAQLCMKNKNINAELHFNANTQQQSQQAKPVASESSSIATSDPVELFKAAYDHENPGSDFVKIFKIRRHLNLPRQEFDKLLTTLASKELLTLNMGNPGKLTREEVQDSFKDEYGDLYITVTWR